MIYILGSLRYSGSFNNPENIRPVIKIGYTSGTLKTRLSAYNTHLPAYEVLYTFEDGKLEDEAMLHKYFESGRNRNMLGYVNEWFDYTDDVMKFFEQNKTIEEIRNSISSIVEVRKVAEKCWKEKLSRKKSLLRSSFFVRYLSAIQLEFQGQDLLEHFDRLNNIALDSSTEDDFLELYQYYLDYWFGEDKRKNIFNRIKESENILASNEELRIWLEKYNDIRSDWSKGLKFLCLECPYSLEDISMFIDPIHYEAVVAFGPEKLKAVLYRKDSISQLFTELFSTEPIVEDIIKTFEVGKKYLARYIKDELVKLYRKHGINRTPKATELKKYFEIKNVFIRSGNSVQKGYQIIKVL